MKFLQTILGFETYLSRNFECMYKPLGDNPSYPQNKVQVQATVWPVIPTAANSISIKINLLDVYK